MRNPAVTLLVLVAVMSAVASNATPITFRDLLDRPRAAPTKVVAYGTAPHQFAELWLPSGPGPHRTLVMIHGGCWRADLPGTELMAYLSEDLRQHGYAVWSIDYRRIGEDGGGYPGTFVDTATGMDKLSAIAAAENLDLRKLVAIGHSAGGHLGTWSAARSRLPQSSPLKKAGPLPVAAVISLAGINDLKTYRATGPASCGGPSTIDALTGAAARKNVDVFADTSPAALLPIGVRQIVVSGALDKIVPPAFGKNYAAAAATKGDSVKEITIESAGHFELIDPTSDAWKTIRAEINTLMK